MHERYRQTDDRQTDGRAIAYSEREREFTFAKNRLIFAEVMTKNKVAVFLEHCVQSVRVWRAHARRKISKLKQKFVEWYSGGNSRFKCKYTLRINELRFSHELVICGTYTLDVFLRGRFLYA